MKLLSISIPNYNRIDRLEHLISNIAKNIAENKLENKVEICISDDCSSDNPEILVKKSNQNIQILIFAIDVIRLIWEWIIIFCKV